MVAPFQIYRHFKGNLYLIISVANSSSDLQPVVVYMSLNGDNQVWTRDLSEFESLAPEGKENPTGQKYRFELVKDMRSILSQCTTQNLVEELKKRPDSPFNEIDMNGMNDKVVGRTYILGYVDPASDTLTPILHGDSKKELVAYAERHPEYINSRTKVFKSVLIEEQSFD